MSKYIIEIKPEYEDKFRGVMILGAENSNLYVDSNTVDELEELTSDYVNEHFGELQDEAYQRGFEKGKDVRIKGCEGCMYQDTTIEHNPCNLCCNAFLNRWTAKDDKIEVGDVVNIKNTGDGLGIVTKKHKNQFYILWADGSSGLWDSKGVVKTGNHFDIDKFLDEIKGDSDK